MMALSSAVWQPAEHVSLRPESLGAAALTFGAALIGIAIDYPFHVAVHVPRPPARPDALGAVWPALRLSVLTTLIAFLPIALSSLPGIAQLGVLAASGIAAAGLTTRYLLPHVLAPLPAQAGGPWPSLTRAVDGLSTVRLPLAGAVIVALGYCLYQGGSLLEHDVAQLSPIDKNQRLLDRDLRRELNAPDVRRLIVIEAESAEAVLRVSERLLPALDDLVAANSLGGYDAAARYLPSRRTQAERLAAVPPRQRLAAALSLAGANLPVKAGSFDAFADDLARARALGPIGPQALTATALGWRIEPLLYRAGAGWNGLITLRGVAVPERLAEIAARHSGGRAVYIDLKDEYDAIISHHRRQALIWIAVGIAVAVLALAVALRRLRTVVRIVAPVAAALVLTTAAVSLAGGKLSIFHLLALLLVVGLGLDYAIFFNRMFDGSPASARTLKALLLCCATSVAVFAILAFSSTPVLHGIGLTVAIGAVFDLLCAFVFARDKAPGTVRSAH